MFGNYTFFFPRKCTNLTCFPLGRKKSLCVWLNCWCASEQACRCIVWNQKEVKGGSRISELRFLQRHVRCPHPCTACLGNQPVQLQELLGTLSKNRDIQELGVLANRRRKSILCIKDMIRSLLAVNRHVGTHCAQRYRVSKALAGMSEASTLGFPAPRLPFSQECEELMMPLTLILPF